MLLELALMIGAFVLVWGGLIFIIVRRRRGRSEPLVEGRRTPAGAGEAERQKQELTDMMRDVVEKPGGL